MNLDPALLDILVCPDCRATLVVDDQHSELVCTGCGLAYPVRDDIPVLLVDEARRPNHDGPDHDGPDHDGPDGEAAAGGGVGEGTAGEPPH